VCFLKSGKQNNWHHGGHFVYKIITPRSVKLSSTGLYTNQQTATSLSGPRRAIVRKEINSPRSVDRGRDESTQREAARMRSDMREW
jgi:hypothetical protein